MSMGRSFPIVYFVLLLAMALLVVLKTGVVYLFHSKRYINVNDYSGEGRPTFSMQELKFYQNDVLWNASKLPGLRRDLCSARHEVGWCHPILKKLKQHRRRTIILTQASCAFTPLAVNLADQIQKYGHELVVIAEDCGAYTLLQTANVHVCSPLSLKKTSSLGDSFNTEGFLEITTMRPLYVALVLKQGFNVLWMDSDSVPLSDPLGFIGGLTETVLVDGNRNDNHYRSVNYCSCFFYVSDTLDNIMWMEEWVHVMAHNYTEKNDQPAYNIAYKKLRNDGRLQRTIVLPRTLYPNGADYPKFKKSSAWIHANRRIGLKAKVGFLQKCIDISSRFSDINELTNEHCIEKSN